MIDNNVLSTKASMAYRAKLERWKARDRAKRMGVALFNPLCFFLRVCVETRANGRRLLFVFLALM